MTETSTTATDDADPKDGGLLYGMPAIAAYLDVTTRQAHHLKDKGGMPTFKLAGKVCARKKHLRMWLALNSSWDPTGRGA